MRENAQLELRGLTKAFDGEPVLRGIDLTLARGEVVVLLGPSGCGKSTLLRCVNGLETPDAGTILLDGEALPRKGKRLSEMRQKIGMVFQSYDLFPHKTILENITLSPIVVQKRPRAEVKAEAEALLRRVGMLDKRDAYPRALSGGQKQRAAIVRALCMHPEVLLLDEITAALDPEMVHEVLAFVLELAGQGMTMLIVTHEMQFARAVADRVVLLDGGVIVEQGAPEAFFAAPKTRRAAEFLKTFTYERKQETTGEQS